MAAINLIRVDEEKNMARFYKRDNQRTLFGGGEVREWGRIGRPGTVMVETHHARDNADIALISKWSKKRLRGYR